MKFVSFNHDHLQKPGLVLDTGCVLDVQATASQWVKEGRVASDLLEQGAFDSVISIIEGQATVLPILREMEKSGQSAIVIHVAEDEILAPIPRPRKNVFCVGRNYIDHVTEGYTARGLAIHIPEHPQFFTKPPTAVTGPTSKIPFDPRTMARLDYEVELGIVIGKPGKDISERDALDYVFGYTIINDLTARDLQRKHDQWFKGKALDASCPMGPHIVHRDEIADPQNLAISLTVNGEVRQKASTSQMIFSLRRIISDLSQGMTLEAGDIIATGTPSGVGYAMASPSVLIPGDVVRCEIESIGSSENRIGVTSGESGFMNPKMERAHV